jgi:hypothetical protein
MKLDRYALGALVGAATLVAGGGVAAAASGDGAHGTRCAARVAKIAERRGVTVDQLQATVRAHLLARIDAAEKAGRISSKRAAALRQRVSAGSLCRAAAKVHARVAVRGMLVRAARFLDLNRSELRAQLPGHSLADLAESQGKSTSGLEAAMVAPAKARLAKAVAGGKLDRARAEALMARLEQSAHRLATHDFRSR